MQHCVISDNDIAIPPVKNGKIDFDKMLEKIKAKAKTDLTSVKAGQYEIINATKWDYIISTSLGDKTNYLATIGNLP